MGIEPPAPYPRERVVNALSSRLRVRHLELFRHVCEQRTLRKAAALAHMTQPAATKMIRELEDMLGVQLFARGRQGMRLTQYGQALRRQVDVLLTDTGNLAREMELCAQGVSGQLRLGVLVGWNSDLLSHALALVVQRNSSARFTLQEGTTTELLVALQRNEVELLFGRVLDVDMARGLRVVPVYAEPYFVVCAAGHPLSGQRKITWADLVRYGWILSESSTPMRQITRGLFHRQGVLQPRVVVETNNTEKMRQLVAASQLLALLPQSLALEGRRQGLLAILLPRVRLRFEPISIIHRDDVELTPLARTFIETVRETAPPLAGAGRERSIGPRQAPKT